MDKLQFKVTRFPGITINVELYGYGERFQPKKYKISYLEKDLNQIVKALRIESRGGLQKRVNGSICNRGYVVKNRDRIILTKRIKGD